MIDASHLHSLFEHATEGIILVNGTGEIVSLNPAAEKMFGYPAGEIISQPIEILIPESIRARHKKYREDFNHHPSHRVMGHGRDLNGQRKDGSNFPVEVSLSHYTRNGQLFLIVFIVDITERKRIETNLAKKQEELQRISDEIRMLNAELEKKVADRTLELTEALDKERQLNEIKSRFVSMASHEFRTPLSTILSSASLLKKYSKSEEQDKRDRHIEKIAQSVKNLNDILEDFLSLGKLDDGKLSLQEKEINLYELLYKVTEDLHDQLKAEQKLEIEYQGEHYFRTDPKLVRNILLNLISNAIKFSKEGTIVSIQVANEGDKLLIHVKDQGIGIPVEDQPYLFSSFFRAKNATNIQGTGLGLHIVKRYAELLGAEIKLETELNKGTSIQLIIPEKK